MVKIMVITSPTPPRFFRSFASALLTGSSILSSSVPFRPIIAKNLHHLPPLFQFFELSNIKILYLYNETTRNHLQGRRTTKVLRILRNLWSLFIFLLAPAIQYFLIAAVSLSNRANCISRWRSYDSFFTQLFC